MDWVQVITAILALVGALLGGYLSQVAGGRVAERREDRRLIREAQVAFERWVATRVGPVNPGYPGVPYEQMKPVSEKAFADFFDRHFSATVEAKAALGVVRRFDPRIGQVLDVERWDIPAEKIDEIRHALQRADQKVKLL